MHPYEKKILQISKKVTNLVVLTAENRFCLRNIPPLLGERFIDVGIAEQSMVGISAGLAKAGKLPVIHALSTFLTMRAFEFIRTDLGYPKLPSMLVGTFTGFNSTGNGPTHQAVEDIGLMQLINSVDIFAPSNIFELIKIFDFTDKIKRPLYIRYIDDDTVNLGVNNFEWGKNSCEVEGDEVAFLSYGTMLKYCIQCSQELEMEEKLTPSVYNFRFIKPLDTKLLTRIINKYKKIVIVEDHFTIGGLASIVKSYSVDISKKVKLLEINLGNEFFKPGRFTDVLKFQRMDTASIKNRILKFI